jgi:hypothetical protein
MLFFLVLKVVKNRGLDVGKAFFGPCQHTAPDFLKFCVGEEITRTSDNLVIPSHSSL